MFYSMKIMLGLSQSQLILGILFIYGSMYTHCWRQLLTIYIVIRNSLCLHCLYNICEFFFTSRQGSVKVFELKYFVCENIFYLFTHSTGIKYSFFSAVPSWIVDLLFQRLLAESYCLLGIAASYVVLITWMSRTVIRQVNYS